LIADYDASSVPEGCGGAVGEACGEYDGIPSVIPAVAAQYKSGAGASKWMGAAHLYICSLTLMRPSGNVSESKNDWDKDRQIYRRPGVVGSGMQLPSWKFAEFIQD
jgi:hypothetical protein